MERKKNSVGSVVSLITLSVFAIIMLVPFLIALSTSFAGELDIYYKDYNIFFHRYIVDNYVELFRYYNVVGGMVNSFIYLIPPVGLGVIASAMAAYALSRINFPGRNVVFFTLLSTMVVPYVIIMIPSYTMFTNFYHWNDTPWPLIIPGIFGGAGTMFFIRQYYLNFPKELEEAAQIDGMGRFGIFFTIALPLAKPVIITQLILSANGAYNDYLGPLLYVGTVEDYQTLQIVLATIPTKQNTPYPLMLAGSIVSLIPTLILFVACQKYFINGISVSSEIKG